jgi:imidazoleglycerol-phosphate dehydratase/histidinol-phosphatase
MMRIIVNKSLLNLHSDLSKGLISSLKKLQARGVKISLYPTPTLSDPIIHRILELEGINFESESTKDYQINYFITDKKSQKVKSKQILVGKKRRNKNISDAIEFVLSKVRSAQHDRITNETSVKIKLNLDGSGNYKINTGIGFFDHMLEQLSKHSNIDMMIFVKGDLKVDFHHTVEDTGITLGECLVKALGDKKGIKRFGFMLPMDDSIAQTAIDLSGRPYLNFRVRFAREKVGEFPTELVEEFFRGLTIGMKSNIFIKASGKNDHHKIEAIFKSFAKSLNEAVRFDERSENNLPTTKGKL